MISKLIIWFLVKIYCPHFNKWIVSEFSEYEQWAGCMACGRRLA